MNVQKMLGSGPSTLVVDVLVAAWVVLCVLLGIAVADAAMELTALSDGVRDAGGAVVSSGEAIGGVEIPVVGEAFKDVGTQISDTGREVASGGDASRESIEDFARVLGFAVAAIPAIPVLAYYLPPRLGRGREIRAVKSMRSAAGDDPLFVEFLARRAVEQLPYRRLRKISDRPWLDLLEGRHDELAKAELRRVGVIRTRLPAAQQQES